MNYLSIKGGTNGRKSDGFLGHDDLLRATGDDLINASIVFEHVTLISPTKVNRSAIYNTIISVRTIMLREQPASTSYVLTVSPP